MPEYPPWLTLPVCLLFVPIGLLSLAALLWNTFTTLIGAFDAHPVHSDLAPFLDV